MIWWQRLLSTGGVVALGISMAACSGHPSGGSVSESRTSSTFRVTTSPATTPNPGEIRKDVHLINCGATRGGWSAGGTVQSSLSHTATYIITVFFTSSASENLDYASTSVPLKTGQAKLWSVDAIFAAPSTVHCVLTTVTAN